MLDVLSTSLHRSNSVRLATRGLINTYLLHRERKEKKEKKYRTSLFCVFSSHLFWTSSSLDGVTQEEGHIGFLIHLPSTVRALIFLARRIQPFLSLVDREVQFCVLTI